MFLVSAHDLSSWNLYEKMDSLLTFRRHQGSLPTEVRAEGAGVGPCWGEEGVLRGEKGSEGREALGEGPDGREAWGRVMRGGKNPGPGEWF